MDTGLPRQLTKPNRDHSTNIGRYIKVDREPRVCRTKVDNPSIIHHPPLALVFGHVGELEVDGDPPLGKHTGVDAPLDIPYQNRNVEVPFLQWILGVLQPPFAE